jgi:hypothetical protein
MSYVFVLNGNKEVLNPMHPARVRELLDKGKAVVFKQYPFHHYLKKNHRKSNDSTVED